MQKNGTAKNVLSNILIASMKLIKMKEKYFNIKDKSLIAIKII